MGVLQWMAKARGEKNEKCPSYLIDAYCMVTLNNLIEGIIFPFYKLLSSRG